MTKAPSAKDEMTSRSPTFTNWIVANSTLLIGIPYILCYWDRWSWLSVLAWVTVIAASYLMHVSETRRGLPGVHPFNRWATEFLWLDRIVAMAAGAWVAWCTLTVPGFATVGVVCGGLISLVAMAVSQNVPMHNDLFAATHSLWHFGALIIFSRSLPRV